MGLERGGPRVLAVQAHEASFLGRCAELAAIQGQRWLYSSKLNVRAT